MDAATLTIFRHLYASVAEEMGVTLGRTAFSPNIKERLDFSCAIFLGDGQLLAQAAHIPVHLGAMPASVQAALQACGPFAPGDVVILNDPYQGGTHLPDVTLVSPVFFDKTGHLLREARSPGVLPEEPQFFVASRAHHADIGGMSPGSMPLSTELFQEGLIIPPVKLASAGERNEALWKLILSNVRTPSEREGDLVAQLAAHTIGQQRLAQIVERYGLEPALMQADLLIAYAERLTRTALARVPEGCYTFEDYLDDDGQTSSQPRIQAKLTIAASEMSVDFAGSSAAVAGNINAVPAIAHSAVAYCLRCVALALLGHDLPMNQGALNPIRVIIAPNSLLDPTPPHAVAAGNVETSQRIVDVTFGALAQALPDLIPAASQGTMNNLTFGSMPSEPVAHEAGHGSPFAYYETIGGGIGAGPDGAGGHGMHAHMSNTRNTPVEALEYAFPLQVTVYQLRPGSGGDGRHRGGMGIIRGIRFRRAVRATLVSERRQRGPYGLAGGNAGSPGRNLLIRAGRERALPGKGTFDLQAGDEVRIETPGGGGWGLTGTAS
ncbi:MAG: hydantoinase B/oxoprolinase family protein [Candidatus Promineifilaceae bacterium]|nr:hydantoinase B/oxoprolinase family protein [Candidatus Promineifilaceae bacterium]